eukprot:17219-Heterococcus_DN1.PRE.2
MDEYAYYYAAERCNLELLDWLFDIGCPHNVEDLCYFAMCSVDSKTIPVLRWLQQYGIFNSAATLTLALNYAGAGNTNLAAAQWMRQQGAEWPAVLCSEHEANPVPWRDDTLEWARAEGLAVCLRSKRADHELQRAAKDIWMVPVLLLAAPHYLASLCTAMLAANRCTFATAVAHVRVSYHGLELDTTARQQQCDRTCTVLNCKSMGLCVSVVAVAAAVLANKHRNIHSTRTRYQIVLSRCTAVNSAFTAACKRCMTREFQRTENCLLG